MRIPTRLLPERRCPVCWRVSRPTMHGNIAGHWDSIGRDRCPASGEPYDITDTAPTADTFPRRIAS